MNQHSYEPPLVFSDRHYDDNNSDPPVVVDDDGGATDNHQPPRTGDEPQTATNDNPRARNAFNAAMDFARNAPGV